MLWCNPPYSQNVKTKIAKDFLSLAAGQFPQEHKYHKIFNRNNVKISYGCSPNFKQHINTHNMNIATNQIPNNERTCNCANKDLCPLYQQWLTTCIVYQADLTSIENPQHEKSYIGISESSLKNAMQVTKKHLTSKNTKKIQYRQKNFGNLKKITKHLLLKGKS